MKNLLMKSLPLVFVTLFLVACGGGDPLVKEVKQSLDNRDYDAALASANAAIEVNPENATAYFYKARTYAEIAQSISQPDMRVDAYTQMRENFLKARELYAEQGIVSGESQFIDIYLGNNWGREHNLGIEYLVNDSTIASVQNPYEISIAHFSNAIVIIPDSVLSYEAIAEAYRLNGDLPNTIKYLSEVVELKNPPSSEDYNRLATFQILEKQFEDALVTLEEGLDLYPDSTDLFISLTDVYLSLGDTDKAITAAEKLIEEDSSNPQFHLVLATQLYKTATELDDQLTLNNQQIITLKDNAKNLRGAEKRNVEAQIAEIQAENASLKAEMNPLIDRSIKELKITTDLRPNDANSFNILGIIYQNLAAGLFEERNLETEDNDRANRIDAEAKEVLRQAMVNYERATEINPDNKEYWTSLFRVYTTLGMLEKAEAAMEKAGL